MFGFVLSIAVQTRLFKTNIISTGCIKRSVSLLSPCMPDPSEIILPTKKKYLQLFCSLLTQLSGWFQRSAVSQSHFGFCKWILYLKKGKKTMQYNTVRVIIKKHLSKLCQWICPARSDFYSAAVLNQECKFSICILRNYGFPWKFASSPMRRTDMGRSVLCSLSLVMHLPAFKRFYSSDSETISDIETRFFSTFQPPFTKRP